MLCICRRDFDEHGFNDEGLHIIHVAARDGDLKTVKEQLDKKVDVDVLQRKARALLCIGARGKDILALPSCLLNTRPQLMHPTKTKKHRSSTLFTAHRSPTWSSC